VLDAGVKIALAVDSSHGMLWKEAYWMVELGASPLRTLTALTRGASEVCCLADQLGTIEPGKLADIISLDRDPLQDISALKDVRLIMKEGARYDGYLQPWPVH
jgi:imidazolonepropionase-like amidohydrolase